VLHVHLVLVARYRRGVLTGDMTRYLAEVPGKVREESSAVLTECNGEDDHVHLRVGYPPKVPVASLVNSLKGVSARRLRQRHKARTHREHLWSPSYIAALYGGAPLTIIQAYTENQPTPERGQAAIPSLNAGACTAQITGNGGAAAGLAHWARVTPSTESTKRCAGATSRPRSSKKVSAARRPFQLAGSTSAGRPGSR
jgi:putative transposase